CFRSKRRHTMLVSEWSSDVCSSDLFFRRPPPQLLLRQRRVARRRCGWLQWRHCRSRSWRRSSCGGGRLKKLSSIFPELRDSPSQNGRAAWWGKEEERVGGEVCEQRQ